MRFLGDFPGKLLTNSKILNDRRGATAIEYALIASLISVAAIVSFNTLGGKVESGFNDVNQTLGNAI